MYLLQCASPETDAAMTGISSRTYCRDKHTLRLASAHLEAQRVNLQVHAAQDVGSCLIRRQTHNVASACSKPILFRNNVMNCLGWNLQPRHDASMSYGNTQSRCMSKERRTTMSSESMQRVGNWGCTAHRVCGTSEYRNSKSLMEPLDLREHELIESPYVLEGDNST